MNSIFFNMFFKFFNIDLTYKPDLKDIPSNCFGVFTTIRRNTRISTWPEDIHGCIGYWNSNYLELSREFLYNKTIAVSYDAFFNDNRRDYFPEIQNDPLSVIELDFMKLPIYSVDSSSGILGNGEKFDNANYGLITEDTLSNAKATYLPNVFPNKSWDYIKKSLIEKADSSSNSRFYAYKISQKKQSLLDIIHSDLLANFLKSKFCKFIEFSYSKLNFVAFSVENNKILIDKSEDIRNIGIIRDVLKYNSDLGIKKSDKLEKFLVDNIEFYLSRKNKLSSQSLSFLIDLISENDKKNECNKLIDYLEKAEREFEFGEISLGLLKECNINNNIKNKIISRLISNKIESVFQWNWDSQVLYLLDFPRNTYEIYRDWILDYLDNIDLSKFETNYLAVSFEGLKGYKFASDTKLSSLRFRLFLEIMKRYSNGYYNFLDNSSARMDITCHFLNGF